MPIKGRQNPELVGKERLTLLCTFDTMILLSWNQRAVKALRCLGYQEYESHREKQSDTGGISELLVMGVVYELGNWLSLERRIVTQILCTILQCHLRHPGQISVLLYNLHSLQFQVEFLVYSIPPYWN